MRYVAPCTTSKLYGIIFSFGVRTSLPSSHAARAVELGGVLEAGLERRAVDLDLDELVLVRVERVDVADLDRALPEALEAPGQERRHREVRARSPRASCRSRSRGGPCPRGARARPGSPPRRSRRPCPCRRAPPRRAAPRSRRRPGPSRRTRPREGEPPSGRPPSRASPDFSNVTSTRARTSPQRPGWIIGTPFSRVSGMRRCVWPVRRRSIPGTFESAATRFSSSVPSGSPVLRSTSGPLWISATTKSHFSLPRRTGTRRAAVSTGSSQRRPGRLRAGSQFGMFGVVRPRMPMRIPATVLTRYSGKRGRAVRDVPRVRRQPRKRGLLLRLAQDREAEVELVVPDRHRVVLSCALIASAIGSAPFDGSFACRNSIGVPWIVSPASRRRTFGVSLRIAATRVATRARPSSARWARW